MSNLDFNPPTGEAAPYPQPPSESQFHPLEALRNFLSRQSVSPPAQVTPPEPQLPPTQPQPQQQKNLNELFPPIPDVKPIEPLPGPDPHKPIQQYIPRSFRQHHAWGTEPPNVTQAKKNPDYMASGPHFPAVDESLRILQTAPRQLANFSAPAIAQQANIVSSLASFLGPFFDLMSNNAFSTNYRNRMLGGLQQQEAQMRMREMQMNMAQDQIVLQGQNLIMQHKALMAQYGAIFTDLGNKIREHPENTRQYQEEAKDEIRRLNAQNNHGFMNYMLDNNDLSGVWNTLSNEDRQLQDIWGAVLSQQQARTKAGKGPSSLTSLIDTGKASDPTAGTTGTTAATPTGLEQFGIPSERKPAEKAETGEPSSEAEVDKDVADASGMPTTGGMGLVKDLVENGKANGMTQSELGKEDERIAIAAHNYRDRVSKIMANPNLTPEQRSAAISAMNPSLGKKIQDVADYKINPKDLDESVRSNFETWAAGVNKNYKASNYDIAKEFSDFGKPTNRIMASADAIPQNALNAMTLINKMKEDEIIPARIVERLIKGDLQGDPKWGALNEAMQILIQNSSSVQTGTAVRVTLADRMMSRAKDTMSPAQLRLIIQQDAADIWAKSHNYIRQWQQISGTDLPPAFSVDSVRGYNTLLLMNAGTGQVPANSDPPWLAISKDPSKTRYPSYVKDRSAPLTPAQVRDIDEGIKALRNSTNSSDQERLRILMSRLPPVQNGPWENPGWD